jgi:uncharacterized protein (DUF362 family)
MLEVGKAKKKCVFPVYRPTLKFGTKNIVGFIKKKKKKKKKKSQPTDPNFEELVIGNTHIFFLA